MKYENFKEVKEIVEQIDKYNSLLKELKASDVSVKILTGQYCVATIGAFASCEHEATDMAVQFVSRLIEHYTGKVAVLTHNLSRL